MRASKLVDQHWTAAILAIAAIGLIIRLVAIGLYQHAGNDLETYYQYAARVLAGVNPYSSPPVVGGYTTMIGDPPPAEVGLYVLLLHIWNSPSVIRLWFAAADVGVILVVGLMLQRPQLWRLMAATFYAVSPLIVGTWVVISEDKGPYLLLILLVVKGLESNAPVLSWGAAAATVTLRQISALFFLPLVIHQVRNYGKWSVPPYAALFAAAAVVGLAPFWPESVAYATRRDTRLDLSPIHSSILILLNSLHVYTSALLRPLLVLTNLGVLALQIWRKLDSVEAVILSVTGFFVFLPDTPLNRLAFVVILLLLVVHLGKWRWVWLWSLTTIATIFEFGGYSAAQHVLAGLSIGWLFQSGSFAVALTANLPVALMLYYWISDRRRGLTIQQGFRPAPGRP